MPHGDYKPGSYQISQSAICGCRKGVERCFRLAPSSKTGVCREVMLDWYHKWVTVAKVGKQQ